VKDVSFRGVRKAFAILLALIGLGLTGAYLYSLFSLNFWINRDIESLSAYPWVLIKEKERTKGEKETEAEKIESELIAAHGAGRLVVELSRSDIRYNYLKSRAYVKVFLKTALPEDPAKNTQIKCLTILKRNNGVWKVESIQDLSLE